MDGVGQGQLLDWIVGSLGMLASALFALAWKMQSSINSRFDSRISKLEDRFDREYMKTLHDIQAQMTDLNNGIQKQIGTLSSAQAVVTNSVQHLKEELNHQESLLDQRLESLVQGATQPIHELLNKVSSKLGV